MEPEEKAKELAEKILSANKYLSTASLKKICKISIDETIKEIARIGIDTNTTQSDFICHASIQRLEEVKQSIERL